MSAAECIAAIKGASDLSDDEILEIAEAILKKRKKLIADGSVDRLDQRMAELAAREGERARLAAALARKHAALNVIARDRLEAQVDRLVAQGLSPRDAIRAVLIGTTKGVAEGRVSVAARRLSYERRYLGEMRAEIVRDRPHVEAMLHDEALNADTIREIYELRAEIHGGGRPGSTGNDDARFLADLLTRYSERSRTDLNRLGATIGRLAGWAPQTHHPAKVRKVTAAQWIDAVLPELDLDRSFPDLDGDEQAIREVLEETYTSIVTGRDDRLTAAEKGEHVGPANLAKSLGKHRVLHFQSADAWLAYARQFGDPNVIGAIIAHQRRAARLAAQMDALGPNPEVMLASLVESRQRKVRNDPDMDVQAKAKEIERLTLAPLTPLGSAYAEVRGLTLVPVNARAAEIGAGTRGGQSMAKLGGALLSAVFPDVVIAAANLRFQGMPLFQAYGRLLSEALQGRGRGEAREVAFLVGEGFDGLTGHIISPYVAEDSAPGAISKALVTFFKWSGLSGQADVMRAAIARILAANAGMHAATPFADLDPAFAHVLGLHGLDEARWEAVRKAAWTGESGARYLTADRVAALDDDVIDTLIDPDLIEAGERGGAPRRPGQAQGKAPAPQDFTVEGPPRPAFAPDFPPVAVHRMGGAFGAPIKKHPRWAAAKNGDTEAAAELARDLMRPETVDAIRKTLAGRTPTVVPVHSPDGSRNRIPAAYATRLADALGLEVDTDIVQVVRGHTGLTRSGRLSARAAFDGPVERGAEYLIVDDHATMGGTVADLRAHIEAGGGTVVLVSTLSGNRTSAILAPGADTLAGLRRRFPDLEDWWRARFGTGFEGLTHGEAQHLLRFSSADTIRNRIAEGRSQAGGPGAAGDPRPGEGGGDGGRGGEADVDDTRLARLRADARRDLEIRTAAFLADEVSFSHIESDEASRAVSLQGTRPGTAVGEALRFVMQFKGFPIAFSQRVLGRAIHGGRGQRLDPVHIGHLIVGLTIAGYMSMSAKDIAKGYEPRQPETPRQWAKVIAAAMVQGGGLGIYGDFLFGAANRFGGSALATAAGPTLGTAAQLIEMWQRAREGDVRAADFLRVVLSNAPGANLFYLRPALDGLFLSALHESVSPGYLRRQARRREQDYGQERLYPADWGLWD